MLNFIIGRNHIDLDPVRMDSRLYFSQAAEDSWFESDFGRRVIKAIDQAEVLFGCALKNRFGKGMSTEQLSTGTKTLFLLKYEPDFIYYGSNMGDNCVPFLMEIVKEREKVGKDVTLLLEHFMDISDEYEGMLKVSGKSVSIFEYECAYSDWCAEIAKLYEEEYENDGL